MKFFKRNVTFVRTNPKDRPSIRFEKIIFIQLKKEGYRYLKSRNSFVKDFEFGRRNISFSYVSTMGMIASVQCSSTIVFTDLEKAFKRIYPSYGWTDWTLQFVQQWPDSWMCDPKTGEYTDKSINRLAAQFFNRIKPEIDDFFSRNADYIALEHTYNSNPGDFFDYLPSSRLEKRILNGLLLAKALNPDNYDSLKKDYWALVDKYKGNDGREIRIEVERGIQRMENEQIAVHIESE